MKSPKHFISTLKEVFLSENNALGFFFYVTSHLYIIQNRILTWKLNAFILLIVNVSINIKKYFEEKENQTCMLIFGITSLNLQNSLSSISTLLSMCSKLCLWKCTRYSDRLTETGGNFIEGNLYLCTVHMCIKEQNLFYFIHDAATCIQPRFSQHFFFLDISLGISVKNFELLLRCWCYHEV